MSDTEYFAAKSLGFQLSHALVQGFLAPFPENPTEQQRAAACVAANLLNEAIDRTLQQFAECESPADLGRVFARRIEMDKFVPISFEDKPVDPAHVVEALRTLNDPPERP
jgi:hypothetical protein